MHDLPGFNWHPQLKYGQWVKVVHGAVRSLFTRILSSISIRLCIFLGILMCVLVCMDTELNVIITYNVPSIMLPLSWF